MGHDSFAKQYLDVPAEATAVPRQPSACLSEIGAQRLLLELDETRPRANEDTLLPNVPGYELVSHIGSGGTGSVYTAFREGSDHLVAIKLLTRETATSRHTPWRELDLLQRLRLTGVPRLLDFGEAEGRTFLVTEYVEGRPIDEFVNLHRLSLRQLLELTCRVLELVHLVHEHGIIHRDLKPSNILIDQVGDPVIIDLGAAVLAAANGDERRSGSSAVIGTIAFMAPEQAKQDDAPASIRCDLFSLAATFMYLRTGRSIHNLSGSPHEVLERIAFSQRCSVRQIDLSLPTAVAAILDTALDHDPAKRFSSAAAFANSIRQWLAGYPVDVAHATRLTRVALYVRRNPMLVSLAFCSTAACTLLVIAAMHAGVQASLAEEREQMLAEHREFGQNMKVHGEQLRQIVSALLHDSRVSLEEGKLGNSLVAIRALDDLLRNQHLFGETLVTDHSQQRREAISQVIRELYLLDETGNTQLDRRLQHLLRDLESSRDAMLND